MSTPRNLMVLGKPYTVQTVTGRLGQEEEVDGETTAGTHDGLACVIQLRAGQHPASTRETLLHEILHALDDGMGMGLKERQIVALANGLLSLTQGAKEAIGYIFGLEADRGPTHYIARRTVCGHCQAHYIVVGPGVSLSAQCPECATSNALEAVVEEEPR